MDGMGNQTGKFCQRRDKGESGAQELGLQRDSDQPGIQKPVLHPVPIMSWSTVDSGFPGCRDGKAVKNPPANAGDVRDAGSIPRSERSPGGGHGNLLQYSCLENPMDGVGWATAYRVAKSQTQLK